jgi:hypothetical protein
VCVECAQATLSAVLTQAQSSSDAQAAATAESARANAQATLDAVSATVSAAQTQEQNNANIIAIQVAATSEINRANAQATLVAAGSTQSAAQTQDAIRQTQVHESIQMTSDLSTQSAVGTLTQQNKNVIADGTQTAVMEHIATQTQSALATSQVATEQARANQTKDQNQIAFVGMWCLLISIPVAIGLGLGIFLRWLKNRETQRRIDMQLATPETGSEISAPVIIEHNSSPVNLQYPLTKPSDHVREWLEEVRRKLLNSKKDDNNDKPGI